MGYHTSLDGEITFEPPLSATEFADSPFTEFSDRGSWLLKFEAPHLLVPFTDDVTKAYGIEEELQQIVDAMPGTTFTGYISGEGEENGDTWRLYVRDGRVVMVVPDIVWPAE